MMNILLDSMADLDSFQAAVGAVEKIAVISQQPRYGLSSKEPQSVPHLTAKKRIVPFRHIPQRYKNEYS